MARADRRTSYPERDRRPWFGGMASPPRCVPPYLVRLVMRTSAIHTVRPGRSSVIALQERGGIADIGRGSGVSSSGGPLADGTAAPGNSANGCGGAGGDDGSGSVASGSLTPDGRGCWDGRSGAGADGEDDNSGTVARRGSQLLPPHRQTRQAQQTEKGGGTSEAGTEEAGQSAAAAGQRPSASVAKRQTWKSTRYPLCGTRGRRRP